MRNARNIAIIALVALLVAFLPGGGQAAEAAITVLMIAFLATLGFAARQIYRETGSPTTPFPTTSAPCCSARSAFLC